MASYSVPVPYSVVVLASWFTFRVDVDALGLSVPDRERKPSEDGGRGGMGDVAQGVANDEGGKTDEIGGRAFRRKVYVIVQQGLKTEWTDVWVVLHRSTLYPEFYLWDSYVFFAREDAVGASYQAKWAEGTGGGAKDGFSSVPETCNWPISINKDSAGETLVRRGREGRLEAGMGFLTLQTADFAARKELLLVAEAESNAS
jgi:hypothetical protein